MNQNKEKCLHCGTPTAQKADGKPYCSMDCIDQRRRERDGEVLRCPYPGCDWKHVYDSSNGLSRSVAYHKADEHRDMHRDNGGESA